MSISNSFTEQVTDGAMFESAVRCLADVRGYSRSSIDCLSFLLSVRDAGQVAPILRHRHTTLGGSGRGDSNRPPRGSRGPTNGSRHRRYTVWADTIMQGIISDPAWKAPGEEIFHRKHALGHRSRKHSKKSVTLIRSYDAP